ncbi:MAG: hypothetical protein M5U12_26250 [Verrucomicrobia bacterium]|nr:hypothetical protein [Verrucomicrobiota bacterium]
MFGEVAVDVAVNDVAPLIRVDDDGRGEAGSSAPAGSGASEVHSSA